MKALAKEPAARYQSCREFFDELRNYRSLTTNPNATLPAGGLPLNNLSPGNSSQDPQFAATSRALNSRTRNPTQTPLVRRNCHHPSSRAKKIQSCHHRARRHLLLTVIAFGALKIARSQAARQQNRGGGSLKQIMDPPQPNQSKTGASQSSAPSSAPVDPASTPDPVTPGGNKSPAVPSHSANAPSNSLSSVAAEYKGRLEQVALENHLRSRLSIKGSGSTLMLFGKLRPVEQSELLKFLRSAPAGVQVVDDIQYDDSPNKNSSADDSKHAAASPGVAAIHIITNVIGATASLGGSDQSASRQCETPCGFSGLPPGNYNLQVSKTGFQPLRTVLQLDAGKTIDQRLQLEPRKIANFPAARPTCSAARRCPAISAALTPGNVFSARLRDAFPSRRR